MLKKQVQQKVVTLIEKQKTLQSTDIHSIELYKEEKDYVERNQILPDTLKGQIKLVEISSDSRFIEAYIEKCDKESEQLISIEGSAFLNQPIEFLKKHKNMFIYLESNWLEVIGVDAISLEEDDIFKTYDVMTGLKLPKKNEPVIKAYLNNRLKGNEPKYDLMFSHDEGIWNLNFTLNYTDGFNEAMSIGEAYRNIYHFLFNLVEEAEKNI